MNKYKNSVFEIRFGIYIVIILLTLTCLSSPFFSFAMFHITNKSLAIKLPRRYVVCCCCCYWGASTSIHGTQTHLHQSPLEVIDIIFCFVCMYDRFMDVQERTLTYTFSGPLRCNQIWVPNVCVYVRAVCVLSASVVRRVWEIRCQGSTTYS